MIKNDWQLRVTQAQIKNFQDSLFVLKGLPEKKTQPWLRSVQRESLQSELKNLREQVSQYELLKTGQIALPGPEAVQQIPELLIKTRISKGLNQEALAIKLGVSKQCIQQYEQSNYQHVTLGAIHKIMLVLAEHNSIKHVADSSALSEKAVSPRRVKTTSVAKRMKSTMNTTKAPKRAP
jgi:ribosome-binding protein aMBF1 (putative translation factor)